MPHFLKRKIQFYIYNTQNDASVLVSIYNKKA